MARQYHVSTRTAWRWIARGVDPSSLACRSSASGRTYRFTPKARRNANPLRRDVCRIRWAFNTLTRSASAYGITSEDLANLDELHRRIGAACAAWRTALDGGSEAEGGEA